ncbi:MAG: PHA/PHB synthase family protein [Steroidobacteraceae bacterium]
MSARSADAAPTGTTAEQMNRDLQAQLATITGGLAPEPFIQAWWDWYLGLSQAPETQAQITQDAWAKAMDTWQFAAQAASGSSAAAVTDDRRFAHEGWNQWPFNVYARGHKNWESWFQSSLSSVPGIDAGSAQRVEFVGRQVMDSVSPTNYLHTNPELLEQTRAESGQNLVRGYKHWVEDVQSALSGNKPSASDEFVVGRDIATTPGKVVLRNDLIELIQYSPQTPNVHAEPILITPPWIMKYYILDLSPGKSLVQYLVEQGHTVFLMSWKNPTEIDRNLGIDDYLNLGFMEALDAVSAIVPERKIHMVGYCIGGTLSFIGTSLLAQRGDQRIGSLSLFASLCDFSEPGELSLFIDPKQLAMLDAMMAKKGFLDSKEMGAAFQLLRSYDLMWTPLVNNYVRGKRDKLNDLMAWNADGTRMPCRMHSEYLSKLYLENQLANNQFEIGGELVNLSAITVPMLVVGTETDHVTPWRSVYKARQHTRSEDYTFLLTSGGHNAGIVSGPSNPKRRYRSLHFSDAQSSMPADEWFKGTAPQPGSWWPVWQQWLAARSSGEKVSPPAMGNGDQGYWPTVDAPGEYVMQR